MNKSLNELQMEFSKLPSKVFDEKKLEIAFKKLLKNLDVTEDVKYTNKLYLQPFKIEYDIETKMGIKEYTFNLEDQIQEKGDQYSKLMYKDDNGKLKVVKSFGKVSKLDKKILNKLLFLVRFSQYSHKLRELFSLELVILNQFSK